MKKAIAFIIFSCCCILLHAQNMATNNPLPSNAQLEWSKMDFYLFVHFGPNTFTDLEWGKGTEAEDVFNPINLDCGQWCRIAIAAGAKGIIITAKHHDGFCLWPSKFSKHTVAQSKWRNGNGDVLRELSDSCKKYGLKMGVYLSPWDRNHPEYGTPEYNDVFVNMMKEVVKNYGPFFEFWWDGANGEGPNGKKQVYDWTRFKHTMKTIAPNTVVFSDIGPGIRWVGNENGIAGDPNWNTLDTAGFTPGGGAPPTDTLNHGNVNGKAWIPAECDVSIRPGWFYHAEQDDSVKTPEQLFELYLKSVGRGANLLLNVPPDREGLINEHDSAALVGFKKLRDESFGNDLMDSAAVIQSFGTYAMSRPIVLQDKNDTTFITLDTDTTDTIFHTEVWFDTTVRQTGQTKKINCIVLQEPIKFGQQIKKFEVVLNGLNPITHKYETYWLHGTTIGKKRILTFPTQYVDSFTLKILEAKGAPLLSEISAYLIDDKLIEMRN